LQKGCWCCGAAEEVLDLHHKTYKRLGKERLTDLCRLCRYCHKQVHQLATGKGLSLWTATIKWRQRMQRGWRRAKKAVTKAEHQLIKAHAIIPTPEQFYDKKNWNRATLRTWGVSWPPQSGWKKKLEKKVLQQAGVDHDR
jgi:hypothetical protein